MSEKGANIDLLFRNGLKDYEVLPPPGVWDGIHAAVKVKSRPVIFLRIAAVAAVLLTVGIVTYRWSREITNTPVSALALNIKSAQPVIVVPYDEPPVRASVQEQISGNTSEVISQSDNIVSLPDESEISSDPVPVMNIREARSLSILKKSKVSNPFPSHNYSSNSTSLEIKYPGFQYLPEEIPAKPVNRWSIAAMASPTYYSGINSGTSDLSSQIASSEQPLFSYSGGLSFAYKISKRFSIQSGLYYSSLGQKVDGINSFSGFQQYSTSKGDHNFAVLTSSGTVMTNNPDVFLSASSSDRIQTAYTNDVFDPKKASLQPVNNSLNQNFSYLEFPVILKYKLIDKTIGVNLIGGLSYNLLVHNTVYTTLDGSVYPIGDTKGLNPLSLSSSLGMGMEYNISTKLSLNLEPTFRYYLNPFSVTTGSYTHPYTFGIFSGFSYKF
jgi:hypothetical protein